MAKKCQVSGSNMPLLPDTFFLIDLTEDYGLIKVSGEAAFSFLQGQLTVDLKTLTPAQNLGAFCNPKGRVRALFRIFTHTQDYYLQLPLAILPNTLAELQKYAKFSKVLLEDVSPAWQRFGVIGQDLEKILPTLNPNILLLHFPDLIPRVEFFGPRDLLIPLWEELLPFAKIQNFETWKLCDIKAGIPEIWPETVERFLPHDINLPALGAVSFTKGCYCGQEIIARMQYLGKLKKHIKPVTLVNTQEIPTPGSQCPSGIVITAALSSENTVEALVLY